MNKRPLPYETSLEDVLVKIKKAIYNPNIGKISQVPLKNGPQTYRLATLIEIVNPETKEFHHYSLRLDTIKRTKKTGWKSKLESSIRLEGGEKDEIITLHKFLSVALEGKLADADGDVRIVGKEAYNQLQKFVEELPKLPSMDKLEIVKAVLSQFEDSEENIQDYISVFQKSNALALKNIVAASRLVEYRRAFDYMKNLVSECCDSESVIQKHLKQNPWMFGSEYSELIDRRNWTRDDQLDFMLRRTVDGYLEIVEIKTPFKDDLFRYDSSHESYYPSAKLSPVLGQVMRYIEEVERYRDNIIVKDHCDPLKIRARIIIGRDGEKGHQKALRNFNHHLHCIEIITFEQLLRIADIVLAIFEGEHKKEKVIKVEDDLPF